MSNSAVAYYRVSTQRQGISGLGLEAQKSSVEAFARGRDLTISETFVEVESGRKNDRPELTAALAACRDIGATLVIAKLDRLARNAAFLLSLQDSDINFVAVDLPDANELTIGMMAVLAQYEQRMISERTKAALQARKARGLPHGWAMPERQHQVEEAAAKGRAMLTSRADRKAVEVAEVVADVRAAGITTLTGIAKALNDRGDVKPARKGSRWHPSTVRAALIRAAAISSNTANEQKSVAA